MKTFIYIIQDPLGIHARPAGLIAKLAKAHPDTDIIIQKGDSSAKADQLIRLMGLGIKQGDAIEIRCEGADEEAALEDMQSFFRQNL